MFPCSYHCSGAGADGDVLASRGLSKDNRQRLRREAPSRSTCRSRIPCNFRFIPERVICGWSSGRPAYPQGFYSIHDSGVLLGSCDCLVFVWISMKESEGISVRYIVVLVHSRVGYIFNQSHNRSRTSMIDIATVKCEFNPMFSQTISRRAPVLKGRNGLIPHHDKNQYASLLFTPSQSDSEIMPVWISCLLHFTFWLRHIGRVRRCLL
jgi:hypothetical protein